MIVVPIAGESRRFIEAGFMGPKWAINIGNCSMLELAISSIMKIRSNDEDILVIVQQKDLKYLERILPNEILEITTICVLKAITRGQADSVIQGLGEISYPKSQRLIIWCGDSYISALDPKLKNFKGNHLVLSKLEGNQWSFAQVSSGLVKKTTEKIKISEFASVGLYFFESIETFMNLNLNLDLQANETYIAPLYNQLIRAKNNVTYSIIKKEDFYSFGTPEELIQNASRFIKRIH
jgi:dTDP-glucose pyrophosphorylase